jgi:hypothetical protein
LLDERSFLGNNPSADSLRGQVKRTFKKVTVLAGFMDDLFFRTFAKDHLYSVCGREREDLLAKVEEARKMVAGLGAEHLSDPELGPIDAKAVSHIEADETFQMAYAARPHRFSWIDPRKLISLQVSRQVGDEFVPWGRDPLIDWALPLDWKVPAEISFVPPCGPIYMTSNNPQLGGFQLAMDKRTGYVTIKPNSQINLIQVVRFQGRYYLRNGYHRVTAALASGISELPVLVAEASHPSEVELTNLGLAGFNVRQLMDVKRPPLVGDFNTDASIVIRMREKRYCLCINLQTTTMNIPV